MRAAVAFVVGLLVLSAVVAGVGAGVAQDSDSEDDQACDPELSVTYDEFRTDQEVVDEYNSTGDAERTQSNTRVRLEEASPWQRLTVENGNNYCVQFTVQIASEIIQPATIGNVGAAEADVDAQWRAAYDFDTDEQYTEVTIHAPPETELLFAPSEARVMSLQWTSKAKEGSGTIRDFTGSLFSGELEERHYDLEGEAGDTVTVRLTDNSTDRQIGSWQGTYEIDGDTRPLTQDSGEPVFYRELEGQNQTAIEVAFNQDAEVSFTAEPTVREQLTHDTLQWRSGFDEITDVDVDLPFFILGGGL